VGTRRLGVASVRARIGGPPMISSRPGAEEDTAGVTETVQGLRCHSQFQRVTRGVLARALPLPLPRRKRHAI
jgi:hypothetical protein